MTRLLATFFLSIATAAPPKSLLGRGRWREVGQALEATQAAEFERALKDGLTPAFQRELLAAHFTTAADRAYLQANAAAFTTPYQPRTFRAIEGGYRITAPNGRDYTLTMDAGGQSRVNGRLVEARGLERFATDVHAALHRTYVTRWSPLLPARVEATPVTGAIGAIAMIGYFVWSHFRSGGYPGKVAGHFASLAATCAAQRREHGLSYEASSTSRAFEELASKEIIERASVSDQAECDVAVERAIVTPGATLPPKFSDAEHARVCEAAHTFMTCAEGFRANARGPRVDRAELIEKSSPTGQ